MTLSRRTTAAVLGTAGLVLGILTAGQGLASAAPARAGGTYVCTGTLTSPGELLGTYSNVVISGACAVQTGPVHVTGNLTVAPNGILNAVYGADGSYITIGGNLLALKNASVMLGCDTVYATIFVNASGGPLSVPEFPCIDDPNPNAPTFTSHDTVGGSIIATDSLGVVVHNATIGGSFSVLGATGGDSCTPEGVFNYDVFFPPYSFLADSTVRGSASIIGTDTCWTGVIRTNIGGSLIVTGVTNGDPDGNEIVTNTVHGSLVCLDDSPAVQFGDSNGQPNLVRGAAVGQCAFGVTALNPAPEAGISDWTPVVQPISLPLR
jgi:hypothetical protein